MQSSRKSDEGRITFRKVEKRRRCSRKAKILGTENGERNGWNDANRKVDESRVNATNPEGSPKAEEEIERMPAWIEMGTDSA
jgi:hypothetical protein